jgi:hypothetical protein
MHLVSDDLEQVPMGCLDTIEIGARKMTIQTEFFLRPTWRVETKVYLGGALKKVYAEDLAGKAPAELQAFVNNFHEEKKRDIVAGLQKMNR